jgi:transcriptional regulator with XRE-family HTH domain
MEKTTSFEEFENELRKNTKYRKAERRIKPYYDLALEIIKRRLSLGLTQKELAVKAKTYQSRISKIESSEFDIRLSTLTSIAEALDTEVSIKLVPTSEIFYNTDNFYKSLFGTTVVVSQQKSENIDLKGPQYQISFSGQVSS